MKCYQKAFADADQALKVDPTHQKSLSRRGTAAYYLQDFKQARRDFQSVLAREPGNKQFQSYLEKSEERLRKIREEAYEKMTRSVMFTDLVQMGFEEQATTVFVSEMNLDEKQA